MSKRRAEQVDAMRLFLEAKFLRRKSELSALLMMRDGDQEELYRYPPREFGVNVSYLMTTVNIQLHHTGTSATRSSLMRAFKQLIESKDIVTNYDSKNLNARHAWVAFMPESHLCEFYEKMKQDNQVREESHKRREAIMAEGLFETNRIAHRLNRLIANEAQYVSVIADQFGKCSINFNSPEHARLVANIIEARLK